MEEGRELTTQEGVVMSRKLVNLSEIDLDDLEQEEAVYAIGEPIKGREVPARLIPKRLPIYCWYVGEAEDLQRRTKEHFREDEDNDCLRNYMQSDKTKLMVYELMLGSTKEKRLEKEKEWKEEFEPECQQE
jgi:predicted GIY-YIG superfamily endonuclease